MSLIDSCIWDIQNKLYEKKMLRANENVKFITENCAVLERFTGNHYTYRAVNIYNLKSNPLLCRKNILEKKEYLSITDKVKTLEINKTGTPHHRTKIDRAKMLLSKLFIDILPKHGLNLRKNQLSLSMQMLEGLQDSSISLMEAEVGIGKTYAYIVAVVIHSLFSDSSIPTIISTSTIALQQAITQEYIPQISDILMEHKIINKPLSFVVRKGKSHYVCDRRIEKYLSVVENGNYGEDKHLVRDLILLSDMTHKEIDLDQYSFSRYVKDKICVNNKCNNNCPNYKICRFMRFSEMCMNGTFDFQIANHNYVMANIIAQKYGSNRLLPQYGTVIFDEAHKLYDVAKQMYGSYLPENEIANLVAYIRMSNLKDLNMPAILSNCDRLEKCNDKIFEELLKRVQPNFSESENGRVAARFSAVGQYYIRQLSEALTEMIQYIFSCDDKRIGSRGKNIRKMCRSISVKLAVFMEPDNMICWLESKRKCCVICAIPKELNRTLSEDIWKENIPYILTSGTISVGGDFDLLKNKTGINFIAPGRIKEMSKASLFDYCNNTLLYIPEYIPFPNIRQPKYILSVITQIDSLLKATYGHSLVLFTSYWLMERVYNQISLKEYPYPLFVMNRGRIDALNNFKASRNGVLFASDIAGEGIDIAGDTLSSLIIVKLPFGVPDPISEYEQTILGGLQEYLDKVNTPSMIIKLKQYAGRLIRTESDTGVISILDSRVNSYGKYREMVLDSLFKTTVTNDIKDVVKFIGRKKEKAYFE